MGADKFIGNHGHTINYNTISVVRPSTAGKTSNIKSNLVRVTSIQIKNGRTKAYKHLIP